MQVLAVSDTRASRLQQETHSQRWRESSAAAFLFLATVAFVIWQNSRVAVLWDLGYLLDTSWRIALGQIPYRDFPLVHPPLTFLAQAALMKLAGRHYWLTIAYAAFAGGTSTVLTWRIVRRVLLSEAGPQCSRGLAFLLALPLIFLSITSIYPHPIYDSDCVLAILLALWVLLRSSYALGANARWWCLAAGGASVIPVFVKQNMGLPFVLGVAMSVALLWVVGEDPGSNRRPAWILAGIAAGFGMAFSAIAAWAGLANYFRWTIQFAAQRRMPASGAMLSVYKQPDLLWMAPTALFGMLLIYSAKARPWGGRAVGALLVAAPMISRVAFLFINDDGDERTDSLLTMWPLWMLIAAVIGVLGLRSKVTMGSLLPFVALAAIHGTFMSQQLWGSTYALWPLLIILIATVIGHLLVRAPKATQSTTAVVTFTLLVCGGVYAASLERLNYVSIPASPVEHSALPSLKGMSDRGDYLRNFDELTAFVAREIPQGDATLLVPGEDPYYFATGRTPLFPVTLLDPTTDPYSAEQLLSEMRSINVRWVIVKRVLQSAEDPMPDGARTLRLVQSEYALERRLAGYEVYRRR